jgi:putative hemolysin
MNLTNAFLKFQPITRTESPEISISDFRYEVKLAETESEIDEALRLRFEVFNLELNEGFSASYETLRDEDDFDEQFHHLIVTERHSERIIGTYRLQTCEMAKSGMGFFSDTEFELDMLGRFMLKRSVELGRACIAKEHRNGRVLFLLWKGIYQYMRIQRKRFLFGCCSLNSQNPKEGFILMEHLHSNGRVHPTLRVFPKKGFACFSVLYENSPTVCPTIPPLMDMYFRYGARVYSYPALDRDFKSIDFLMVIDTEKLDTERKKLLL